MTDKIRRKGQMIVTSGVKKLGKYAKLTGKCYVSISPFFYQCNVMRQMKICLYICFMQY